MLNPSTPAATGEASVNDWEDADALESAQDEEDDSLVVVGAAGTGDQLHDYCCCPLPERAQTGEPNDANSESADAVRSLHGSWFQGADSKFFVV